jgi:RNA binding exosome subunit
MNLQQTIQTIKDSPSSIFTKDDVLKIMNSLEVEAGATVSPDKIESISKEICRAVEDRLDELVSISSITVSAGNYGNGIDSLEVEIEDFQLSRIVTDVLIDELIPEEEPIQATQIN